LYYSLLEKFSANQSDVVQKIRGELSGGDPKTAERLAHTLRGIAGTLGAESLQGLAEQLEYNIKNDSPGNNESLLAQIDQEVTSLIARIDQAIKARI
jgi:HPt (histidine-containing phosphotransfer) domain-containing protein